MERRVELLGDERRGHARGERERQPDQQQTAAVGRGRCLGLHRRLYDSELLALPPLLHVLGQARFLVALEQKLVVLFRGLVVTRELLKFLLPPGRGVRPSLVLTNGGPQALLVLAEGLDLSIDFRQRRLDPARGG